MNNRQITELFSRLRAQNPHPVSELHYQSHFELLIAVLLSAQATDKSVNKATTRLFLAYNTPETLLALGEEGLKKYINTLNFYHTKAKHIIKTCQLLIENFHSEVPNTKQALQSLPGVGGKTANVVLNSAFKQRVIGVDTHVFRVANRTQLAVGNTPEAVEKKLLTRIPPSFLLEAHHWLVLHGRYVCKAKKPGCQECVIRDLCEYPDKTG